MKANWHRWLGGRRLCDVSLLLKHNRHQIPQNPDLDHTDNSATLVALKVCVVASDLHHDAATTIDASGFMPD